jgi:ArsR family transcriptional regulator, arsenate/arsenite/antimonite-responsive transcriptional repressor
VLGLRGKDPFRPARIFSCQSIFLSRYTPAGLKLVQIYDCLCDETRLRILHLLARTPLCVCHFQSVLREPQVKISKHLHYLKRRGLVESIQHQNWRIYKLPSKQSYELRRHLHCLQDCIQENKLFREDLKRLQSIAAHASAIVDACCGFQEKPARQRRVPCC